MDGLNHTSQRDASEERSGSEEANTRILRTIDEVGIIIGEEEQEIPERFDSHDNMPRSFSPPASYPIKEPDNILPTGEPRSQGLEEPRSPSPIYKSPSPERPNPSPIARRLRSRSRSASAQPQPQPLKTTDKGLHASRALEAVQESPAREDSSPQSPPAFEFDSDHASTGRPTGSNKRKIPSGGQGQSMTLRSARPVEHESSDSEEDDALDDDYTRAQGSHQASDSEDDEGKVLSQLQPRDDESFLHGADEMDPDVPFGSPLGPDSDEEELSINFPMPITQQEEMDVDEEIDESQEIGTSTQSLYEERPAVDDRGHRLRARVYDAIESRATPPPGPETQDLLYEREKMRERGRRSFGTHHLAQRTLAVSKGKQRQMEDSQAEPDIEFEPSQQLTPTILPRRSSTHHSRTSLASVTNDPTMNRVISGHRSSLHRSRPSNASSVSFAPLPATPSNNGFTAEETSDDNLHGLDGNMKRALLQLAALYRFSPKEVRQKYDLWSGDLGDTKAALEKNRRFLDNA